MTKLVEYLKVNKILGTNDTLFCTTDGCAAQYQSEGTAYYLLSALAVSHGIIIQKDQFRLQDMEKVRTLNYITISIYLY